MDYLDFVPKEEAFVKNLKVYEKHVVCNATHPDSFGILENPNMSMWSCYRKLSPKAQVLHISILNPHPDNPVCTRIQIKSQRKPLN
ncbi:hypothetical protein CesoFtcFv8_027553 [Champsocephalus esox]|uniref:Uncharacterized protein n=1 Tax=Champsocephalus esox TaxID=159716 RepID=A0AAN8AYX5_9TELE|nr:hypothetical protein CesoFtcFv8_027553 [Champsocephalus esox]